jgi:hypothetical protein
VNNKYFNSVNLVSTFKGSALALFFIWPLATLYISLRNYKQDWSKNMFWLFCIFFGYTFIIAGEGGGDSNRYAQRFIEYAHSDLNLKDLWSSFYSATEDSKLDIVLSLINYSVSRITDNPSILFAVFGLIFGYFYSRNMWYLLDRINGNLTGIVSLFLLTFALFNPIWNINGFRFNAAAQIFLYGTLPYLLEGKTKRLIWAGVSILVHFSFLFSVAILILFVLVKNRLHIYLIFFLITSFIKEINIQSMQSVFLLLPDIFHSKVNAYTNLDYAESAQISVQSLNWYVAYLDKMIKWVIYAIVIFIYLFGRKILKERRDMTTLLCYSLLLFGFTNIFSFVPSGGRFFMVGYTFMFAFFTIFIANFPSIKGWTLVKALSTPLLLLFCIVALRWGMDYFGLMTVIGNPLTAVYYSDSIPLIIGIKSLL